MAWLPCNSQTKDAAMFPIIDEIKIFFDVIKLNVEAAKRASPAPTPSTNSSTKESIGKKSLGFSAPPLKVNVPFSPNFKIKYCDLLSLYNFVPNCLTAVS